MSEALSQSKSEHRYPRLARRLRAALIDLAIFILVFFCLATALSGLTMPGILKGTLFVMSFAFLEPGLVSLTGGTIGHHLLGLRIQDRSRGDNLGPVAAIVRFVFKSTIGFISFAFILVTHRHQAIHDLVSGSVVVVRNPTGTDHENELEEQEIYDREYEYPSKHRRVAIILFYNVLVFLAVSLVFGALLSDSCLDQDRCSLFDSIVQLVGSIVWFGLFFAILFHGWSGKLPGARRQRNMGG